MLPRPLSQCYNFKRCLFCQNQHIFVQRLPIKFFYFEDLGWSFFGKITGQSILHTSMKKNNGSVIIHYQIHYQVYKGWFYKLTLLNFEPKTVQALYN